MFEIKMESNAAGVDFVCTNISYSGVNLEVCFVYCSRMIAASMVL